MLRGAAGAALAIPTLDAMLNNHGTAFANGAALPKRFVVWFFGNGVRPESWVPQVKGATWSLSSELSPLEDNVRNIHLKDYVSVVSGYNVKSGLYGHENGITGMLSGAPPLVLSADTSKFSAPTFDQIVAKSIAGTTPFPSIQLGVSRRITNGPSLKFLSHKGPDEPLTPWTEPVDVFNRLFGSTAANDPKNVLRTNILDAVKGDLAKLSAKVGSADKQRLDAHATAISEMRHRLVTTQTAPASCVKPAAPTLKNVPVNGQEPYEAVNRVMSDLMAMALACDLTRVVSYQFTPAVGGHFFDALPVPFPFNISLYSEHEITHNGNVQGRVHEAVLYTMRNLAYTLNKLKTTAEGAGNLLDASCVLATTEVSLGLDHSTNNMPILIAGKAGGALKYPGIHHGSTTGQNTSDVMLALLQAVGVPATSAGVGPGLSTTPCTAILA